MLETGKARQRAREIIKRFDIRKPPVDIIAICHALDIEVLEREIGDDLSGMAFVADNSRVIVVNAAHAITRRRFTIAHELAHHLLHEEQLRGGVHVDRVILKRDSMSAAGTDVKEVAANAFAAEILMPRTLIASEVPASLDVLSEEHVQEISARFGVSPAALSIRLINLK